MIVASCNSLTLLHNSHCSPNAQLFALSLLLSSAESLMVLVLYTCVWLTSARLLTWLLINLRETLLPRSIWLTSIITQQNIWHWDHRNLVIKVYMKKTLTSARDHKHKLHLVQGSYLSLAIPQECAMFKASAAVSVVYCTHPRSHCDSEGVDSVMSLSMAL